VIEAKGKTIVQPIDLPLGDAKRPAPHTLVIDKYIRNAAEVIGADLAKQTSQMLLEIERLPSIRRYWTFWQSGRSRARQHLARKIGSNRGRPPSLLFMAAASPRRPSRPSPTWRFPISDRL